MMHGDTPGRPAVPRVGTLERPTEAVRRPCGAAAAAVPRPSLGLPTAVKREDQRRTVPMPGLQLAASSRLGHLPVAGPASGPLHHPGWHEGMVQAIIRHFPTQRGGRRRTVWTAQRAQTLDFVKFPCSRQLEPAEKC